MRGAAEPWLTQTKDQERRTVPARRASGRRRRGPAAASNRAARAQSEAPKTVLPRRGIEAPVNR